MAAWFEPRPAARGLELLPELWGALKGSMNRGSITYHFSDAQSLQLNLYRIQRTSKGVYPNSNCKLIAMASNLIAMASNPEAMASNLEAMASNLETMAYNLLANVN